MKILFLDQSGNLGGAELCLADIAKLYSGDCLVALFSDGAFRKLLEHHCISVQVLTETSIPIRKDSTLIQGVSSIRSLIPLVTKVANLARGYDLIYANTQKALVIGALASLYSNRPLVYHLHDILSTDHFSYTNRRIAVTLANWFARLVIANSKATQAAFVAAGGRRDIVHIVYNGFDLKHYSRFSSPDILLDINQIKQNLNWNDRFIVGHFSRLSPWKGQHVLLNALAHCPENVAALFVGDALFGEQEYAKSLYQQTEALGLEKRVRFLGFRTDVVPLMSACDLIAHTSTAPEPFGRVIVEAMLCGKPVVAAAAGGAVELIEDGRTGWLSSPGDVTQLAGIIRTAQNQPNDTQAITKAAQLQARQAFNGEQTNQHIAQLLKTVV
ncbi:glycosyltransferase [Leptolyngbya sp. ST-U4]|uniref:glycosyltransferase n=2 Tax=unclassified Leptolyngbya TaxID=2650499 RepID=UPI003298BECD